MKKLILVALLVVVVAGLAIGTSFAIGASSAPAPNVVVLNSLNKMDTKTCYITFLGSNFPSSAEVKLILVSADGIYNDLDSYLVPANTSVMTDANGNFAALFNAGTFVNKKVIKQGVYRVEVTDASYTTLATVPVAFWDGSAPDKFPDWIKMNVAPS